MLRPFLAYVFDAIHNRLREKGQLNEHGNIFYAYNMFVEFSYYDGTIGVFNEANQLILFVSDHYPFALKDGNSTTQEDVLGELELLVDQCMFNTLNFDLL